MSWWRDGVLYQIYPRSFGDSNGDGIGDLRGIVDRLDHLEWLGIDGIWLNPTMPSPNEDWGYDVADYCAVHPDLGTLDDLDALVAEAGRRGIRVLLDLVPNHTSDRHAWFQDALSGRRRDFYVWADPGPGGGPPNNWLSNFGGPAWTLDDRSGQYYLHNFLPTQPDLNWWSEDVREAFDDVLRFWYERGVAGFRIDVCHAIVKDRELRDDPAATPDDHPKVRERGTRQVFSMNRPEVHDVLKRWRRVSEPDRVLVGETYVLDVDQLVPYYGTGEDQLHLAFNFLFVHAALDADELRPVVEAIEAKLPAGAWPVWTGSNHDAGRLASRWAGGRRGEGARGAADAAGAARHAVPLLRRRDRPAGCRARPGRRARPRGAPHRRPRAQPRPPPHADAVERRAGRRLLARRRAAVAAVRRPRPQRRGPARRSGIDAAPRARPDRAAARARRSPRRGLRDIAGARRRLGMAARGADLRRAQPVGRRRPRSSSTARC